MNLNRFNYSLPKENIAQLPKKQRSSSRLLVLNRKNNTLKNDSFINIHNYFSSKDLIIVNDSRVIPARIFGHRKNTKGKVEIFIEKIISKNFFLCQIQSTRKLKFNDLIIIDNSLELRVVNNNGILCEIEILNSNVKFLLDNHGEIPIPPYINRNVLDLDKSYYQTIFAKKDGSVAAPTAALHFDNSVLKNIENKGIKIANITLHIGMGTFSTIKNININEHKMHPEHYCVPNRTIDLISECKKKGGKIIAVGTTTARALESYYSKPQLADKLYETNIFIKPGFKFQIIDHLITNFHLPKSSLLIMISAFHNREKIIESYEFAIKNNYKFFSYGDSNLIL